MSTFDLIPDAPGLLRAESINIALKFERTGETTGRVSWNIPTPAMGCAADQQAYCGMLVTLDTKPSTIDRIPTNGQVYSSDPTADDNLFAGDKLKSSLIIGAFYNDRTTTMFDVTGLKANTPYYVTGFPMDCQYRYFVEGVHAYSTAYLNRGTDDTHGTQVVVLNNTQPQMGVQLDDATGLDPAQTYDFTIQLGVDPKLDRPRDTVDCKLEAHKYTVEVDGSKSQTYEELIDEINSELAKLVPAPQSPQPPNAGGYYWNAAQKKLFSWNGYTYTEIPVIYDSQTPTDVQPGFYWLNPTNNVLSRWDGTNWTVVTVLSTGVDPALPRSDLSYWFDGTIVHLWNGTAWCDVYTYIQTTDPSLAVTPPDGTYWYNTVTKQLMKWNTALEMWFTAEAIQSPTDPLALATGTYWFNESTNVLSILNTPNAGWNPLSNVSLSENAPLTPAPGKLWYNPITQVLYKRDITNTSWVQQSVIVFPTDPAQQNASCDLWWNTTTNQLNVWDPIANAWAVVANFLIQPNDPASAPTIAEGAAWYNPATGKLYIWQNNCFVEVEFTNWPTDPRASIQDGIVWHNTKTNQWFERAFDTWVPIDILVSTIDPTQLPPGSFWFNPSTNGLSMWNGAAWVSVMYSTAPLAPARDTLWYDTVTGKLMVWNGVTWVIATPPATVELDCNGNLLFTDTRLGSSSMVRIYDGTLFKSLSVPYTIHTSAPGTDGASDQPSYDELGVGTSGDDAARNQLANEIRMELGYPIITVEVTKEMIDYAITRALEEIRQKSSIAYKRGFFFMYVKPNEQRYFLTNKISGMNRIVDILSIQRLRSSALSSFGHDSGINGQILSQHLYNMGTFDLLSYHLMSEYGKLMETLFATRIVFSWNEQTRELWMHQNFPYGETVVMIEATAERTEQDILTDRYAKTWVRRYAAASVRLMLSEVRGKFSTLPGAGGAVTLNASDLRQAASAEIETLLEEITYYVADRPEEWGSGSTIVFG